MSLGERLWGRSGAFVAKELCEIRRDRRTVLLAFVLPVLIYPATFTFTTHLERRQAEKTEEKRFRVAVTGEADEIREGIGASPGLVLSGESEADLILRRLRDGVVDVWVDVPADSAEGDLPLVRLVYHGPNEDARDARDRVEAVVGEARSAERDRRYAAAGGTDDLDDLLRVVEVDVATQAEAGGAEAGKTIPFLLIFTLFIGGASLAVDVVAGEKERGTLETLYLTPVERTDIARAKFVVVTAATMLTGTLNLASLVLCYRLGLIGEVGAEGGLVLSTTGIVLCFVLILPLAAMVGGLLLGISAFARSLKEAQYYVMPVTLLAFIPGVLATTQDIRLGPFTALLPVANVAIAIRDALRGEVDVPLVVLVALASVGWGLVVVRWTAGVLSREDTILGFDPEPLFAKTRGGRRRAAFLGMAGTVLGFFYFGQILQARDLQIGLAASLWILLPVMGAAALRFAWTGGALRDVLSLRRPTPAGLVAGAVFGAGAFLPVAEGLMTVQSWFLPTPESFFEFFSDSFTGMSLPVMFLLVSISPGICEEIVFRGVFLGLLRRTGTTRAAVLVSAAMFALIHLSVFRFVPTFALGVGMALIVVRTRSIFPAMLFHMVYNGLAVGIGRLEETPAMITGAPGWAASAALLAGGWMLVRSASAQSHDSPGAGAVRELQADEVDARSDG